MKILLLTMSLCFVSIGWAQTSTDRYMTTELVPSNLERYNIDFKLVDESVIVSDSSILNQIDMINLETFRAQDQNVIVNDAVTGLDVILFYKKKSGKINLLNTTEQ